MARLADCGIAAFATPAMNLDGWFFLDKPKASVGTREDSVAVELGSGGLERIKADSSQERIRICTGDCIGSRG